MNENVQRAISEHLLKLPLRCPMCGGSGLDNWALHRNVVYLPSMDDEMRPIPGQGFPVVLLKCGRCRFVAPFRAAGPDAPQDLSAAT